MIDLKKTELLLLISTCLLSGCESEKSIPEFVDQNAVTAVGVNFDTQQITVINSNTRESVLSCIPATKNNLNLESLTSKTKSATSGMQECARQITDDKNLELTTAIELSQKTIKGFLWENGKKIPANFSVSVTALSEGSICNTIYSGGNQYETCGRRRRR